MLRIIAVLFGVFFIFIGVAGFLPTFNTDGLLFGYFTTHALHNILHMVTGVIAIMTATNAHYARVFFQVVGIVYALLAMIGFWRGDLLMMSVNTADNLFHIIIGVIALYLGFAAKFKQT